MAPHGASARVRSAEAARRGGSGPRERSPRRRWTAGRAIALVLAVGATACSAETEVVGRTTTATSGRPDVGPVMAASRLPTATARPRPAAPGPRAPAAAQARPPAPSPPTTSPGEETATTTAPAAPRAVDVALARLDLDRRIGQLFVAYAFGSSATEVDAHQRAANLALYGVATPAEVVTHHHLGGVILLGRHTHDPASGGLRTGALDSPPQIAWLTAGLQAASFADSGVGLLISTDQEGGPVTRVGPPATQFPAAAVLGATGDVGLVEAVAAATGRELAALGINQVLAPVADVNVEPRNPVIGRRSFGADPLRTAAMVASAVRGYRSVGVAATAKHFPGHGDTTVDSHVGLPVVHHSRAAWHMVDRPPFAAAVEAGVPAVMTAHLSFPALDPSGIAATLSSTILDELRSGLGFEGVIMTDALDMGGVTPGRTPGEVAVGSVLAGADMLLMSPDLRAAQAAVRQAVEAGTITADRLEASVRRILVLKEQVGALGPPHALADLSVVGSEDHRLLRARAGG